jgi:DNA-binding transcriptional regulator GbsR (MarR family)
MPRLRGSINRKTQKAILSTLASAGEPLYVREIIGLTGLRIETAIRALRSLTSKRILVQEKQGKRHYYFMSPAARTVLIDFILAEKWQPVFSAVRTVEKNLRNSNKPSIQLTKAMVEAAKAVAEVEKTLQVFYKIAGEIDESASVCKRNRKEASFLAEELKTAGINFMDLSFQAAYRMLKTYIDYREGYHYMRGRGGGDVFAALEWARECQWMLSSLEHRDTVASQWGFSKGIHEHSEETLRQHYGFKTPRLE